MELRTKAKYSSEETQLERDNRRVAYKAAAESIVLLKNDGILPLRPGKIALYGAGAGMTVKGGTGSGEVNERHSVSILEGLENAGFTVKTKRWIEDYARDFWAGKEAHDAEIAKKHGGFGPLDFIDIMANPYLYPHGRLIDDTDLEESGTDTCIYVVARQAGEGADRRLDRDEFNLSERELCNIRKCASNYKKFVVVINVGGTFDLSFIDDTEGIGAVVFFCQQGMEGGSAFADIISGKVSPSGRLPVSWVKRYDDVPFGREYSSLGGDLTRADYKEGIYVGYRYFDTFGVEPRYEFGFGLSYTKFDISAADTVLNGIDVTVTARVRNTGTEYAGKEVVQLYANCPRGALHKEYQRLAAFAKTKELGPGEEELAALTFNVTELASYSEKDAAYILGKGDYILRLGSSSRKTTPCAVITLHDTVTVSKHTNICAAEKPIQELTSPDKPFRDDLAGVRRFDLHMTHIGTGELRTNAADEKTDTLMTQLSVKDMAELVVGAGMEGGKPWFNVPGAAGFTTSKLITKGIVNVALADGPAGLRLQRTSSANKQGTLLYQYTTAFPVGMAMAATWNGPLLEEMGRAVSREMTEYGVTYWLAPGMNIHRNPLCGRNFEYYSEDPLLTGKLAASITRGVQSTEGNYVTIKHFACNNQEDNRNKVSSNLSERALREIYLRGFEIAVREGGAKSVMSSYNRLNGVYTCNSHDLLTKVLRGEWGFDGAVMTDWMSTSKGFADTAEAIRAGNDLIMPGGESFKKEILEGLRDGVIKEEDLRRCCRNVLKSIVHSGLSSAIL